MSIKRIMSIKNLAKNFDKSTMIDLQPLLDKI